ncbi:MAG TPA: penicillin-binding transpeptidase domain-containing protein [Trueperaceae bacterium]|nr:penicillin-binding transpeptidase domain-containing protein [Trueperaceae bacterium]
MLGRMRLLLALLFTVLAVFTGRLMFLQLIKTEEYALRSIQNANEQRRIEPLRGRILARDGTVLADDRVAFDLLYTGGEAEEWPRIRALLGVDTELRPPDRSKPEELMNGAVVAWNIPDALVPAIEERVAGSPNLYLRERIERTYPTNLAAQVVGYTQQADPINNPGYSINDLVGITGIEASYEAALFGYAGSRRVEIDNRGAEIASHVLWSAQPGYDVVLTLDPQLQRLAEDVLAGSLDYVNEDRLRVGLPTQEVAKGAIIAMDPRTGEVLAMASAPTYDQNVFTHRPSNPEAVAQVLQSLDLPLSNRAVEAYPPASTFKIVTSLAMLENGWATPRKLYPCTATFRFGNITWRNWATYNKGSYDVYDAIADSCNTYFWYAAFDTPGFSSGWAPFIEDVVTRARELGFGRPTGVGLMTEKAGLIPDDAWVRAQPQFEHGWLPGYTLNTVIGQGNVMATPMQLAQFVSTIANRGDMPKPHLVRQIGQQVMEPEFVHLQSAHWETVIDGMELMFTAYPSANTMGPRVFPWTVAGKTGTAQTTRGGDWTHAWFMGFSPVEEPEIAIVVFIEYGGSSSRVSVPVARDFLAGYWELRGVEVASTQ